MLRTNWKTVSTLVTMAVLAGCQERSVAGPEATSIVPAPAIMAPPESPLFSLHGGSSDNTTTDFTVGPGGGVFYTGNHAVIFPANSVCDPATSSYGPGTWDSPCSELRHPIHVHAVVRTDDGRTWVDFTPSLRFVPTTNASRWVWMYMYAPGAVDARDIGRFNILYALSIGGSTIDESKSDPSLRTYVDTRNGMAYRRIKHFSGYTSSSGFACDPNTQTDCHPDPNGLGAPDGT